MAPVGSFSWALEEMKAGRRIARRPWDILEGKDEGEILFLYIVPGSTFKVNRPPLLGIYPMDTEIKYRPHIDARFKDGTCGVWLPNATDVFLGDWYVYGE